MKSQPSLSVVRRLAIQRGEDPTEAVLKFRAARHAALVECAEALKRALNSLPVAGDYDCETGTTTVPYSSREWSELVAATSAAKSALARLDEVEGE